MRGLFVIGTDTDVGKTYVACKLVRAWRAKLRVGVYKPVLSGCQPDEPNDAEQLLAAANIQVGLERVCPQRFEAAVAPPIAAQLAGRQVDEQLLIDGAHWWNDHCDFLVVEGAGGALSPISDNFTVLDLAQRLQLPLLLVVADRLGCVNQTLLTVEAAVHRHLSIFAIVLNRLPCESGNSSNQHQSEQLLRNWLPHTQLVRTENLTELKMD